MVDPRCRPTDLKIRDKLIQEMLLLVFHDLPDEWCAGQSQTGNLAKRRRHAVSLHLCPCWEKMTKTLSRAVCLRRRIQFNGLALRSLLDCRLLGGELAILVLRDRNRPNSKHNGGTVTGRTHKIRVQAADPNSKQYTVSCNPAKISETEN